MAGDPRIRQTRVGSQRSAGVEHAPPHPRAEQGRRPRCLRALLVHEQVSCWRGDPRYHPRSSRHGYGAGVSEQLHRPEAGSPDPQSTDGLRCFGGLSTMNDLEKERAPTRAKSSRISSLYRRMRVGRRRRTYFDYGGPQLDEWIQTERQAAGHRTRAGDLRSASEHLLKRIRQGLRPAYGGTEGRRMSTPPEPLEWANTRLISGDALETLPALKLDSDVPLRTMGSLSLVRNLAGAGLVDRLRLMVFPLICGSAGREHIGSGRFSTLGLAHARDPRRTRRAARVPEDRLALHLNAKLLRHRRRRRRSADRPPIRRRLRRPRPARQGATVWASDPAAAALTAFTNTLCVSLFGLIEHGQIAAPAAGADIAGIVFVLASLLSLIRRGDRRGNDLSILGLLAVTFTAQLITGLRNIGDPAAPAVQHTAAIIIVVCFLSGIARAWELIGGQRVGIAGGIHALLRHRRQTMDEPSSRQTTATEARAPVRPPALRSTSSGADRPPNP